LSYLFLPCLTISFPSLIISLFSPIHHHGHENINVIYIKIQFEINNDNHKMEEKKKVEGGDEEEFCSIGNLGQRALHSFG